MKKLLLFLGLTVLALTISTSNFAQTPSYSVNVSITPIPCNGGYGFINLTLVLDASGPIGPAPHTFAWSTIYPITPTSYLGEGVYNVTITDSLGGIYIDTFLMEPPIIVSNVIASSATTIGGNDGSITITSSGVNQPLTYAWSNGDITQNINNLYAGIYDLTVSDSNGCAHDTTFYVASPSPANWNILPSQNYHTFFVEDNSCVTLDNAALSYGSIIGAFFEDGSQLKCAGKFFWNGQAGSFAVGVTIPGQGYGVPMDGTAIIWRVYDVASGNTYEAHCCSDANYMTAIDVSSPTWITSLYCVKARSSYVQHLSFVPGWSLFGVYLEPDQPNAVDFFAPVVSNLQIVKDEMGLAYWPAYGVNLLGDIAVGKGYAIKMNALTTLDIQGSFFYAETKPLVLNQGWSIFAYYSTTPQNVSQLFACAPYVPCDFEIVKNGSGQIWWAFYNLNTIGDLMPGEGYQVKMNNSVVYSLLPNACN